MKKTISLLAVLFAMIGCASPAADTNPAKVAGISYLSGFGAVVDKSIYPASVSNNTGAVLEKAESCNYSIAGLIAWGESGIETTKKKNQLTQVASVEYERTSFVFGTFTEFCTRVYGSKDAVTSPAATPAGGTEVPAKGAPAKVPAKKK